MPLTAAQRATLEQRLKEEREQVTRSLDRTVNRQADATERDASGDLSAMPFHPADLGTDTMDEELAASNGTRMSNELAEIDDALQRLYHSPETFGVNAATGADIPYDRLLIIPWAKA